MKEDSGFRFPVSGFRFLAAALGTMLAFAGCSKEGSVSKNGGAVTNGAVQARSKTELAEADLLMRVRFAGTTALMADTNAAYLTNIAGLPETAALGQRIVEKMAGLPEKLVKRGTRNAERGTALEPMFADLLRDGFVLELRGDSNGVTRMALGAKANAETATRWNKALAEAARAWFDEEARTDATRWTAGKDRMQVATGNGGVVFVLSSADSPQPSTLNLQLVERPTGSNILEAQLASSLLPGPIRRSTYGGFERFEISAAPHAQSLRIQGKASYAKALPELGTAPVVPTNLVTEPPISFTLLRNPSAWLDAESPFRRLLPNPIPSVAYFWGGATSPYQIFLAMPFAGREEFNAHFGPKLVEQLSEIAKHVDAGGVVLDTNQAGIKWQGHAFVDPQLFVKESDTNTFLYVETFPQTDQGVGLTPALIDRVSARSNLVLYDWEFLPLRYDTWFRVGLLAQFISNYQQIIGDTAFQKWISAAQIQLASGSNTATEITQTGPRELTLARRGPVAFTSLELFWLANWLESPNFPAANFLVPVSQAEGQ